MQEVSEKFTEDQLPQVADRILMHNPDSRIIAFYGKMGVGKTTLIKAICKQLNVFDMASSPTFSIVNQYITSDGQTLYHFDFYRINKQEEAFDLGYEDYFFSGNYCFVEWPEKIEDLLPDDCLKVYLDEVSEIRHIRYQTKNEQL